MSRAAPGPFWVCLALFMFVAPAPVQASKCVETSFEQKLRAADVVFLGKALSQTPERDSVFLVERVFKGEVPKQITAHFFGVKYAMLFPPQRYLVFGSVEPDTTAPGAPPLLTVETCAGSVAAKFATEELGKLGPGRPPGKLLARGNSSSDTGAPEEPPAPPSEDAGSAALPEPADAVAAPTPSASAVTTPPRPNPAATPADAGGCAGCKVGSEPRASGLLWLAALASLALARRVRA